MNRRDAALIAHLDALEQRWTVTLHSYFTQIMGELAQLRAEIANLKLELATHGHADDD